METPGVSAASPLLKLTRVSKSFGGLKAVDGVDLEIESGEVRGLIGPNGSGKTTLFNVITGFIHADEGTVLFRNKDITKRSPDGIYKDGIGRTFQLGKLFADMTALENVMVGTYAKTRNKQRAKERAEGLLKYVNMYDKRNNSVQKLTVLDKKLTELARGLATEPKLVLLDEVMAGLNQVELDYMHTIIRKIHESGSTVIMVEHIMSSVMLLCGKITVLNFGQKIAEGTPTKIAQDELVVKAYLGQPWQGTQK